MNGSQWHDNEESIKQEWNARNYFASLGMLHFEYHQLDVMLSHLQHAPEFLEAKKAVEARKREIRCLLADEFHILSIQRLDEIVSAFEKCGERQERATEHAPTFSDSKPLEQRAQDPWAEAKKKHHEHLSRDQSYRAWNHDEDYDGPDR